MKRIYFLLLLSLLMTGSAFAECLMYIDDFTVTPEQLGTEIELCIKAEFSARLNGWQLNLTYPEGITPVDAELGADGYIPYLNASGQEIIHTPTFVYNDDYTRLIATTTDVGYWYDGNGDLTSYGMIKWEGGSYEEMVILHVQVSPDFQGGEIIMDTNCGSGADARGGTIRENGDNGVTFTSSCYVTVWSEPEAYACYTPSNTTLTFYYDGMRSSRPGRTYDLNTGSSNPGWHSDGTNYSVTRVVFNSSFADARPTSTCKWFDGMFITDITDITGMEYLNTSEVTNMSNMFAACMDLKSIDLSHFNTSKVTNMYGMFSECIKLRSLDLSSFNTSKVTDMRYMFDNCSEVTTIYVGSGWSTRAVTSSENMFHYCSDIKGGMGTTYDEDYVDKTYAHIDYGPSNPGYFTAKFTRGDVNDDGNVNITDVTVLINYLLSHNASGVNVQAADTNQDNNVTIQDVTALINYLLSHQW